MYYIGIDLGTSAVKLLLMDEKGTICKIVSREYPLSFPHPGWSEQNPEDWYEKTLDGLKELTADIDRSQVRGMSFGGQMHGLVMLDKDDQVIRPAILWNDGRSQRQVEYLNETIGRDVISGYTGNIAFAGFTAPKILWVRENEPENFEKTARIMLPKDYLAYRLSGAFVTDYSDASGMLLLDVKHKRWSEEMCGLCGISDAQLPRLCESWEKVGTLKKEIADALGLPGDVIIAAGAGDNAAAAVGTGTVGPDRCTLSLGTSGTIFISSDTFRVDPNNALHSFAHADGKFHLMGCMLSAASCNKWWMDSILKTQDYGREQEEIHNLGKNHVYFLPYLMGERSPLNDPKARATFTGITMDTTREDMTQAVLEGVAFAFRDMFEVVKSLGIHPANATICGGGAKSPLWRTIMANVLNITVQIPENEQGPGMGAAMLAMVADGVYESVEAAAEAIVTMKAEEKPDPQLAALYEKRYREFQTLYPALKPVFAGLSD